MDKAAATFLRPLERGLRAITYLAECPLGATLSDIGRAINAPKSSLADVLQVLVSMEFAQYNGKLYRVGPQAIALAARVMGNHAIFYAASPVLEALASNTGENVALARFDADAGKLIYTHKVSGTHPIRFNMEIGDERDLYCSNGGRVMLAHQPDEWIERYLATTKLKAYTAHTITKPERIMAEIQTIRKNGVAHSIEEMFEGGAGFAAPIYNAEGRLASVLVITTIAVRAKRNKSNFLQQAKQAAADISAHLGFNPIRNANALPIC